MLEGRYTKARKESIYSVDLVRRRDAGPPGRHRVERRSPQTWHHPREREDGAFWLLCCCTPTRVQRRLCTAVQTDTRHARKATLLRVPASGGAWCVVRVQGWDFRFPGWTCSAALVFGSFLCSRLVLLACLRSISAYEWFGWLHMHVPMQALEMRHEALDDLLLDTSEEVKQIEVGTPPPPPPLRYCALTYCMGLGTSPYHRHRHCHCRTCAQ